MAILDIENINSELCTLISNWDSQIFNLGQFYERAIKLIEAAEKIDEYQLIKKEKALKQNIDMIKWFIRAIPYEFIDESYFDFILNILSYKEKLNPKSQRKIREKYLPKASLKQRVEKHRNSKYYKRFVELYDSISFENKIDDLANFNYAVGNTVSYSSYATSNIKHPSGKVIKWLDIGFEDLKVTCKPPIYTNYGFCWAGLTSGGLEIVLPYSITLNFSKNEVTFKLGDIFPNCEDVYNKFNGSEISEYPVILDTEKFFPELKARYYRGVARDLFRNIKEKKSNAGICRAP